MYQKENRNRVQNTITMTTKSMLALVVSSSGSLQNGILALMTTIPQISAVLVAEDINSALRMVENHQPALIILDKSLAEVQEVVQQINARCSNIHLIFLVEDIAQQKEAEELGVDNVLLKGFSAQKLIAIVENLIDPQGGTSNIHTNLEGGTKNETA